MSLPSDEVIAEKLVVPDRNYAEMSVYELQVEHLRLTRELVGSDRDALNDIDMGELYLKRWGDKTNPISREIDRVEEFLKVHRSRLLAEAGCPPGLE